MDDLNCDLAVPEFNKGVCSFIAVPYPLPREYQNRLKACFDSRALLYQVEKDMREKIGVRFTRAEFKPLDKLVAYEA
jgi:hypothetical protein